MPDPKRPNANRRDAKKSDAKRRSAVSRPRRVRRDGRAHPRRSPVLRRSWSRRAGASLVNPIRRSIAAASTAAGQRRPEFPVGFTARRAIILAVVMCALTLTVAGPVRTFFAQHAEIKQQSILELTLHRQIEDLRQRKANLADPAYIKAQARDRLGFVMPGEIPYQVQLPPSADITEPDAHFSPVPTDAPWYVALWHTVAEAPHIPPPPPEPAPADG